MKKIVSLVLAICLIFSLANTQAMAASGDQVQKSLESVLNDFPVGSYFTTTGKNGSPSELTKIMTARGLNARGYGVSYTCVGFAKYVWAKVFNHDVTPAYRTEYSSGRAGVKNTWSNAKVGDLVYFYKNSDMKVHSALDVGYQKDNYVHAAIIWAVSDSGVTLYDCNYKQDNRINLYTASFGGYGWPKSYCRLYRAKNYDEVNGSSTNAASNTTPTPSTDNGSALPTIQYFSCNTIISCFNGQTVNLYNDPGNSSRVTYFSKGQAAKSTYGATLSDGSTWYKVSVNHNGSNQALWLKYDSNKMTCQNIQENKETKYNVTLDDGFLCRHITVKNGDSYGTLGTPTKDGYTFDGWYTQESGGTKVTSSAIVSLTSDQTLYAHWTKVESTPTPTHDTHVKGAFQFSEAVHPHRNYYKCSVCGENFTDGTTSYLESCQICNPVKEEKWTDWSNWSAAPVSASATRQVETRTVKVSDAETQYRYGRYLANGHNCWCALYLEGLGYGRASLDITDWSTTQYGTSGRDWSCGYCRGDHTGYDHFSSDGRPWWKEYVSPSGQSYYWEESRTIPAVYETQYRYRDQTN